MEEMNARKRMLILSNVVLMTFMTTLQGSIVNVALPNMAQILSVTEESIAWVITIYMIVIAATILIFGRVSDRIGKSKVFLGGIVLFTIGSLLCGLANSFVYLLIARLIQGIGASATMATNQGIVAQTFPKNERGKALGITGSFVALGSLVGPPLGGLFISVMSWNYIFYVNVPIGILAVIMGLRVLPMEDGRQAIGAAQGEASGPIVAGSGKPVQMKLSAKLLKTFEIFRNGTFSLGILCAFFTFIATSSSIIIQPFYLENVMKHTPAVTGLIMMASPMILLFVAPASGHLSDKIGSEFLTFLGLAISSVGLLLLSTLTQYSALWVLLLFISILSLGNGMFQSPNNSLIMSSVRPDKLGIAGSINSFMRNLGMFSGTALATSLLYNRMSYKLGYRVSDFIPGKEDAFIYGMKYVYIAAATFSAVGAILTAYRLYTGRKNGKVKQVKVG